MIFTVSSEVLRSAKRVQLGVLFLKAALLLGYGQLYIKDKIRSKSLRDLHIRETIIGDAEALGYDPDVEVQLEED